MKPGFRLSAFPYRRFRRPPPSARTSRRRTVQGPAHQVGQRAVQESGLHRTYISGIEHGARNPTVAVVKEMADALGVLPAALLEYETASAEMAE